MSENIPDFDRIDAAAAALQSDNVVQINGEAPQPENQQPVISTAEMLAPLLGLTFQILTPNWKITPQETNQLSEAYAAVIDKYFPDGDMFDQYGAEVGAIAATVMILAPRMKIPRTGKAAEKKAAEKAKNPEVKMDSAA
jgi:hypothetical protein